MYSVQRAVCLFAAALFVQCVAAASAVGALATDLAGGQVEALETILSYFALLSLGIIGTFLGFVRWFLKRWNPKQLDPVTLLMMERLKSDGDLGPLCQRMSNLEDTVKKVVDHIGQDMADQDCKPEWDR